MFQQKNLHKRYLQDIHKSFRLCAKNQNLYVFLFLYLYLLFSFPTLRTIVYNFLSFCKHCSKLLVTTISNCNTSPCIIYRLDKRILCRIHSSRIFINCINTPNPPLFDMILLIAIAYSIFPN